MEVSTALSWFGFCYFFFPCQILSLVLSNVFSILLIKGFKTNEVVELVVERRKLRVIKIATVDKEFT